MHLGQCVVQALAVAERLVDRRVEAVEEPQLELVRALEQVLELGERERDVRRLVPGVGLEPSAGSWTPVSRVVDTHCWRAQWSKNADRFLYSWLSAPGENVTNRYFCARVTAT